MEDESLRMGTRKNKSLDIDNALKEKISIKKEVELQFKFSSRKEENWIKKGKQDGRMGNMEAAENDERERERNESWKMRV